MKNLGKQKNKKNGGITLIALVITIVLNCCKAAMDRVNDKEIDILKIQKILSTIYYVT